MRRERAHLHTDDLHHVRRNRPCPLRARPVGQTWELTVTHGQANMPCDLGTGRSQQGTRRTPKQRVATLLVEEHIGIEGHPSMKRLAKAVRMGVQLLLSLAAVAFNREYEPLPERADIHQLAAE
jgi:hypothetical protein